jgi:hypothetical protein
VDRNGLVGHENAGVSARPDTGADDIGFRDVGEPAKKPTRVEKPPVQELERLHQATVKEQPALADQRIGMVLGHRKLGEDTQ